MFEVRHEPLPNAPRPLQNQRDLFEDIDTIRPRTAQPAPRRAEKELRQPEPLGRMLEPPGEEARPRQPVRNSLPQRSGDLHRADMLLGNMEQPRVAYARPASFEAPGAFLRTRPWLLVMIALVSGLVFWFASASPKTIISSFSGGGVSSAASNSLSSVFKANQLNVPANEHSLVGDPTLTAQFIDQVLAHYGSPAQGTGAIWVAMGERYNIDPAYALAFFIHESSAGTNPGWAGIKPGGGTTHNIGNIICAGYATCFGRFRDYASWDEGIEDWYKLIAKEYVNDRGAATIEQIIPIYAPSFENDVGNYVNTVVDLADAWRQGVVR